MPVLSLTEWQEAVPASYPELRNLRLSATDETIVERLERRGVWKVRERRDGLSVETKSFVGFVQVGSLQLNIQPKLSADLFVSLLRYALDLTQFEHTEEQDIPGTLHAMQDLLVLQLAAEVARLMRRGLHRNYVVREERGQRPRGRLRFDDLAKHPAGGIADIAYRIFERSDDVLPNQVLLAGLRLAGLVAIAPPARMRVQALAADLRTGITPVRLETETFRRLDRSRNRLTDQYEPAFRLIAHLHRGSGLALSQTDDVLRAPGFLFDMNVLFQDTVGKFLVEHLPELEVVQQHRLAQMFQYQADFNPRRKKAPTPRPDYVVMRDGQVVAIADAKYRDLWTTELPAGMLYQLSVYALSYPHCSRATILYPTAASDAREARIDLRDMVTGARRGEVCLRPVNLARLAEHVSGQDTVARRRSRQAFARDLALGPES